MSQEKDCEKLEVNRKLQLKITLLSDDHLWAVSDKQLLHFERHMSY